MELVANNGTVALKVNSLVNLEACNREGSLEGMEGTMVSQDFRRQLEGYGLTTANILFDQACRDPRDRWRVPAALRTEVRLSDVHSTLGPSGTRPPSRKTARPCHFLYP